MKEMLAPGGEEWGSYNLHQHPELLWLIVGELWLENHFRHRDDPCGWPPPGHEDWTLYSRNLCGLASQLFSRFGESWEYYTRLGKDSCPWLKGDERSEEVSRAYLWYARPRPGPAAAHRRRGLERLRLAISTLQEVTPAGSVWDRRPPWLRGKANSLLRRAAEESNGENGAKED